jgi:hypothetical protein
VITRSATAGTQIVWAIRRAQPAHPHTHGSVFYLDGSYVMDLYRMHGGKYKAALLQEVEERIIETRETELSAEQAPVKLGRRQGINSDVFRKYVEKAEPNYSAEHRDGRALIAPTTSWRSTSATRLSPGITHWPPHWTSWTAGYRQQSR